MCEMRRVFERLDMILMSQNNEIRILVRHMAIKKKHLPCFIGSGTNVLYEMLQPADCNLRVCVSCRRQSNYLTALQIIMDPGLHNTHSRAYYERRCGLTSIGRDTLHDRD